jgi:hypothetical protein
VELPDHLHYVEIFEDSGAWPEVYCAIAGCKWCHSTTWSELDPDYGETDWNVLHPAHGVDR